MKGNLLLFSLFVAATLFAQSQPAAKDPTTIVLKAARLLDVRKGVYIENAAILIEGETIKEVGPAAEIESHAPNNAKRVDLGPATVLPGLIDCHTHIMARIPKGDDGYIINLATKSQAFRALEGAYNARITLEAGYTTIRDVESEGSEYADVALRDAITQGLAMARGCRLRRVPSPPWASTTRSASHQI